MTLDCTLLATALANSGINVPNDFSPPIASTGIRKGVFANFALSFASP